MIAMLITRNFIPRIIRTCWNSYRGRFYIVQLETSAIDGSIDLSEIKSLFKKWKSNCYSNAIVSLSLSLSLCACFHSKGNLAPGWKDFSRWGSTSKIEAREQPTIDVRLTRVGVGVCERGAHLFSKKRTRVIHASRDYVKDIDVRENIGTKI